MDPSYPKRNMAKHWKHHSASSSLAMEPARSGSADEGSLACKSFCDNVVSEWLALARAWPPPVDHPHHEMCFDVTVNTALAIWRSCPIVRHHVSLRSL